MFSGETITANGDEITIFSFLKSDLPLTSFETNTTTYTKTQELSTLKIVKCFYYLFSPEIKNKKKKIDMIENCSYENLSNLYKETYKRIIIPFYIPILMMIPFLLIIISKENTNFSKLKVYTFLIGLFLIIFSETTIRIISDNLINNLGLIFIPFLTLILVYLFFHNKFKYSKFIK